MSYPDWIRGATRSFSEIQLYLMGRERLYDAVCNSNPYIHLACGRRKLGSPAAAGTGENDPIGVRHHQRANMTGDSTQTQEMYPRSTWHLGKTRGGLSRRVG